jgi:hypothetical protein
MFFGILGKKVALLIVYGGTLLEMPLEVTQYPLINEWRIVATL